MADNNESIEVTPRPLTVSDAAGLTASIIPQMWAPTQILETDFSEGLDMLTLAADGDVWLIRIIPPSAMPSYVFYPIALKATLVNADADALFDTLFELQGMAAIQSIFEDGVDTPWTYSSFTLDPPFRGFDVTGTFKLQSMEANFRGFPPKLPVSETVGPTENALGALMLTVQTFDAATASSTTLHIDGRWLAFPRQVVKSAGFYQPRLWFNLGGGS